MRIRVSAWRAFSNDRSPMETTLRNSEMTKVKPGAESACMHPGGRLACKDSPNRAALKNAKVVSKTHA